MSLTTRFNQMIFLMLESVIYDNNLMTHLMSYNSLVTAFFKNYAMQKANKLELVF